MTTSVRSLACPERASGAFCTIVAPREKRRKGGNKRGAVLDPLFESEVTLCDELPERWLVMTDDAFKANWVAMLVDTLCFDDDAATVGQIARMLVAVRERYRIIERCRD